METNLKKFLKLHSTNSVPYLTHVSMVHQNGKYYINDTDRVEFWKLYDLALKNNNILGIAETPKQFIPVIVDVDLKIPESKSYVLGEKLYTYTHVKQLIEIYQSKLREIMEDFLEEEMTCVLLEKPSYRKNNIYISGGFHLHFPFIFLDKIVQDVHLISRVKETLKENPIFDDIGIENSETVIDSSCTRNSWLLYGSCKNIDSKPYLLSKIFNSKCEEISLTEAFENYKLYNDRGNIINIKNNLEYYIPQILSTYIYHRKCKYVKNNIISPLKKEIITKQVDDKKYKVEDISKTLPVIKALMNMISESRADDYNNWMEIGWILYNITYGSSEGYKLWISFSSKCQGKFNEDVCIYEWSRMKMGFYTMGTLRYYAKIDNPDAYNTFKEAQAKEHIQTCVEGGSHYDIARALYELFGDVYVCTSMQGNEWFYYYNNHWKNTEQGIELRKKISTVICGMFDTKRKDYWNNITTGDNSIDKGSADKVNKIVKIIGSLKTHPYKINIMKESQEMFYNWEFKQKLDNDPYIIGFKNGVYDLKNHIFREGKPEDFISKTLPINYVNFETYDDRVQEVVLFFEKIFPDSSLRNYFLDNASEIFTGNNPKKLFFMWTGEGDNGKSVTQSLFEQMLGKYAIKVPTTLITGNKPTSGGAWPELARSGKGVRWAVLEEPNAGEKINIGVLKSLTGNDTFIARDLYQKGSELNEITPMFKLIFICNTLPALNSSDMATWNRIKVIPFETKFCNNAPETYEEQLKQKKFPVDREFSNKIPNLLEPLAWYLLERKKNNINITPEPHKVSLATREYKKRNDTYQQFIEECIDEMDNYAISITELYDTFKSWCKCSLPGWNIPIKNDVKEHFSKLWGAPERKLLWKGYKVRTLEDSIEQGKAILLTDNDLVDYNNVSNIL